MPDHNPSSYPPPHFAWLFDVGKSKPCIGTTLRDLTVEVTPRGVKATATQGDVKAQLVLAGAFILAACFASGNW